MNYPKKKVSLCLYNIHRENLVFKNSLCSLQLSDRLLTKTQPLISLSLNFIFERYISALRQAVIRFICKTNKKTIIILCILGEQSNVKKGGKGFCKVAGYNYSIWKLVNTEKKDKTKSYLRLKSENNC